MSMLSAQVDELRELADGIEERYGYPTAVTALRDAADTICELRGALQVASVDYRQLADENAKLRDLMYDRAHDHAIQHMTEDELRITAANALDENRKLRELLQMALTSHNKMCTNRGTCLGCLLFNAKPIAPVCTIVGVVRDARELGVEVEQ